MPQHHDPNERANPIDAANLAIARLHTEREQMLQLIADMRRFLAGFELPVTASDYEFRTALIERADALLERK